MDQDCSSRVTNPSDCIEIIGSNSHNQNTKQLDTYSLQGALNYLKTEDLLNCRTVSRRWWDEATSILRFRNAYKLIFDFTEVPIPSSKDCDAKAYMLCNYYTWRGERSPLSDLNKLLKTSLSIPAVNLRLLSSQSLLNQPILVDDLREFLISHGHLITQLHLGSSAAKPEMKDTLSKYISNCTALETISVDYNSERNDGTEDRNISSVIEAAPSLARLEGIRNNNLIYVVPLKNKIHLIKEFLLNPYRAEIVSLGKFAVLQPTLSTLILQIWDFGRQGEDLRLYNKSPAVLMLLNYIIKCSKDTLQNLHIYFDPYEGLRNILIPRLKVLKDLRLVTFGGNTFDRTLELRGFQFEAGRQIFDFEDFHNENEGYFPRLHKLEVTTDVYKMDNTLMRVFSYYPALSTGKPNRNYNPSVKILNLSGFNFWPEAYEAKLISNMFPNVKILKIRQPRNEELCLSSAIWLLCPQAEYVEVYEFSNAFRGIPSMAHCFVVDSVFTGFGPSFCAYLNANNIFPKNCADEDLDSFNFTRKNPSICDLHSLKKLKIKLGYLTSAFCTMVTVEYALKQMPSLEVVFSMTKSDTADFKEHLTSILPYVKIE